MDTTFDDGFTTWLRTPRPFAPGRSYKLADLRREYRATLKAADKPTHDAYLLPTGEVVRLARDLTRGAWTVDFTLKGGQVVDAVRLTDAQAAARAAR
jgi:hypothetical protein